MSHVRQEIRNQSFNGREFIRTFAPFDMPMVAFPSLVVVAHDAFARITIKQAVLEGVRASGNRFGYKPDCHLYNSAIRIFCSVIERSRSFHMAHHDIHNLWRQETYLQVASLLRHRIAEVRIPRSDSNYLGRPIGQGVELVLPDSSPIHAGISRLPCRIRHTSIRSALST